MIPEQTIEFRYDTQLLIDGYEDLDEDEVFDYIANNFKGDSLLAVGGDGDPIKSTITPMNPGWCWSTAALWARSMTSSLRIWTARREACRDKPGNELRIKLKDKPKSRKAQKQNKIKNRFSSGISSEAAAERFAAAAE